MEDGIRQDSGSSEHASEACIFCKIIKGDIPSSKIYEDEKTFAFLDIAPVHKGHTIIIPKAHHETILDTPEDTLQAVISVVKKLAPVVKDVTGCSGFNIVQNNFPDAGQAVPHLHFHIIPRFKSDGLKFWPQGSYEDGEAAALAEKLRQNL